MRVVALALAIMVSACGSRATSTAPRTPAQPSSEIPPETPPETPTPTQSREPVAITDADVPLGFGLGPGFVYYCDRTIRAVPKNGGAARTLGPCQASSYLLGDGESIYYCEHGGLTRLPAGGGTPVKLVRLETCIFKALDQENVYYILPGFGRDRSPGLYRVPKTGGEPVRVHPTRPGEQIMPVLDGDDIWVGSWNAGTISRLPRAGGRPAPVVTGQKGLVSLGVDPTSLYWYMEGPGEIRRRLKAGGPVEVVGRGVEQEPLIVHAGHAYWFEGARAAPKRLMHLAPGETHAEPLTTHLLFISMRVDNDGIFYTVRDRPGIFRIPLPSS